MVTPPILIQRGTVNYVANPIGLTSASGWTASTDVTVSRTDALPGTPPAGITTGFAATATTDRSVSSQYFAATSVTVETAGPHAASVWVYVPAAWTGGSVGLNVGLFTGASGVLDVDADMGIRDAWQRLVAAPVGIAAGDRAGSIRPYGRRTWVAGQTFWFTAAQIEPGTAATAFTVGTRPNHRLPGFLTLSETRIGPLRVGQKG